VVLGSQHIPIPLPLEADNLAERKGIGLEETDVAYRRIIASVDRAAAAGSARHARHMRARTALGRSSREDLAIAHRMVILAAL